MITRSICRTVQRTSRDGRQCYLVTASPDEKANDTIQPDESSLQSVKAKLAKWGLVLGGELDGTRKPPAPVEQDNYASAPVMIIPDRQSGERPVKAEQMEEYELSVGGVLFCLYVFDMDCDLEWLVGIPIELRQLKEMALP